LFLRRTAIPAFCRKCWARSQEKIGKQKKNIPEQPFSLKRKAMEFAEQLTKGARFERQPSVASFLPQKANTDNKTRAKMWACAPMIFSKNCMKKYIFSILLKILTIFLDRRLGE